MKPAARVAQTTWLRLHADVAFVLLAALLATLPLLLRGTSCGHDLGFHLLNWQEVATQWANGTLRPFWAFHAAWNAGEPRFVFYPPLSWTLGALLGLVLPWTATPVAFTFIVLVLCGLTMRALLRRFVAPTLAVAGACVYVANPYMLFVAYERTAYAELLAAAWMPLLLLVVLQRRIQPVHLGLVVALLWLTNAPAAVVGSYALLVIAMVRLVSIARGNLSTLLPDLRHDVLRLTGGYLLGLALAGFFLVPALAQRRLVQLAMAILPGMRPADSFLFGHTSNAFHDAVLRSASWIAVGILTVALLCSLILLRRRNTPQPYRSMHALGTAQHRADRMAPSAVPALAVLSVVVLFLLTRFSAPVWTHAPQLAFLQFPWRFLSMEAAAAVLLLALVFTSRSARTHRPTLALALLFATAMPWAANALYRQACDDEDAPAAQRALYLNERGIEPTDEYTPADADNDALHAGLPSAWLTATDDGGPDPASLPEIVATDDGNPAHLHFDVRASSKSRLLVVRLRSFHGWSLRLDGAAAPLQSSRDDGLVTVALPPDAAHTVEVRPRWTADEYAGLALSLMALLFILLRRDAPEPAISTSVSTSPRASLRQK